MRAGLTIFVVALAFGCESKSTPSGPNTPPPRHTTPGEPAPAVERAAPPLPAAAFAGPKPAPHLEPFRGCEAQGKGGDPDLNRAKNRDDEAVDPPVVDVATFRALPWPEVDRDLKRAEWPLTTAAAVARYEGYAIAIEGFLITGKEEGREATNCGHTEDAFHDIHMWLVSSRGDTKAQAIVVEPTPRIRARHRKWHAATIRAIAGKRIRVSGWVLFDEEHRDQIGSFRATLWEVHPVTRIEVEADDATWKDLDDYTR